MAPVEVASEERNSSSPGAFLPLRYLLIAVFSVCLFTSGIFVGASAGLELSEKDRKAALENVAQIPERLTAKMTVDLNLSDAQAARVLSILKRSYERRAPAYVELQKKIDAEWDLMEIEMKGILTAEQFPVWHAQFQQYRKKHVIKPWQPPEQPTPKKNARSTHKPSDKANSLGPGVSPAPDAPNSPR